VLLILKLNLFCCCCCCSCSTRSVAWQQVNQRMPAEARLVLLNPPQPAAHAAAAAAKLCGEMVRGMHGTHAPGGWTPSYPTLTLHPLP
jgi:hypothetical protein